MVKTALVLCQGVASKDGYLYDLIKDDTFFTSKFSKIVNVPTDEVFALKEPFYMKLLGGLGNKIDDVFDFLLRRKERIEACRMTRNIIKGLELDGYSITLLTHSLGTIIALCCGPNSAANPIIVDTLYMIGSPLGFKYLMMRMKVNSFTERFSNNFVARKIHYLYSEGDPVSCKLNARTIDILESKSMETPSLYHTNSNHDAKEYIQYLKENLVI